MPEHTVNRRTFLKASALGGVTAARASEVHARGTGQGEPRAASLPPFDLEEVSIAALQERMASGAETSSSITQKYLARIAALDTAGPTLRQVLETNPDALAIAAERDAERRAGRVNGPAARRADPAEGQHRHRRPHDDHRGIAGPRRVDPGEGFVRGRSAPRGRRNPAREDEHERVGRTSARRGRRAAGAGVEGW